MKRLLDHRARRTGYDGWALMIRDPEGAGPVLLDWSVCTTRAEARELRRERGDIFERYATRIMKVKLTVEVINARP